LQAAREGVSKAAPIRRYVAERLRSLPPLENDPLRKLVGMIEDGGPDESARIDEVVYGLGGDLRRHLVLGRTCGRG
jgi:hypothetical protein